MDPAELRTHLINGASRRGELHEPAFRIRELRRGELHEPAFPQSLVSNPDSQLAAPKLGAKAGSSYLRL